MSSGAACAHRRVEYRTKDVHLDDSGRAPAGQVGWWQCDSCDEKFLPVHQLEAQGVATAEELEQLGLLPAAEQQQGAEPEPTGTQ